MMDTRQKDTRLDEFLGPNYICHPPADPPPTHLLLLSSDGSCMSSISGVMNVFNKHSGSMGLMKVKENGFGECCCNQRLMSLRG